MVGDKLETPLFTVFIPYYNDKAFLKDTINSVLNQTYENLEIILFNHKSTDGSRKIAHSFDDKRIVHIDADKNLGAGSGLNSYEHFSEFHGKYLKFFCADDILYPKNIEVSVNYLEEHSEKDFVITDAYFINKKGQRKKHDKWFDAKEKEIKFIMNEN